MMKRADMGDYPVAALLLLGHWCQTPVPSDPCPISRRLALGQGSDTGVPSRHSLRSLKIFELYLDMQIISCIIVDGLALLNFLFNYLHYVLGGTGSADRK